MEYFIEANPVIYWASLGQLAGCLLMIAAFLLKRRWAIALSGVASIISSILLSDAVMACGVALAVLVLWRLAGKRPKKTGPEGPEKNKSLKNKY